MESTKTFILRETNIPQQFAMLVSQEVTVVFRDGSQHPATVYNGNDLSTQVNECVDIFSTFIGTCADTLSSPEMKPEEGKAAIVFQNTKGIGEMLLAVVSEYIEEEGEGNWYYSFTFNPDVLTLRISITSLTKNVLSLLSTLRMEKLKLHLPLSVITSKSSLQ